MGAPPRLKVKKLPCPLLNCELTMPTARQATKVIVKDLILTKFVKQKIVQQAINICQMNSIKDNIKQMFVNVGSLSGKVAGCSAKSPSSKPGHYISL